MYLHFDPMDRQEKHFTRGTRHKQSLNVTTSSLKIVFTLHRGGEMVICFTLSDVQCFPRIWWSLGWILSGIAILTVALELR